ncbi:hypothetical protein DUNSADRAFT_5070 [Dunaliella salina]|uniref:Uncharacterized protein n=1 Tax=Dunaliella salina TaxID=3046 RepID=A0ABQ7HAF6_DUNSA|nr:hypothetical protein DUNSADRAFT_5070 [Dunaliella salina]|eukprot:KAF5843833.1 hypothetical protein DUNSADRAFT_5070 [Dunaliella salina]
MPKVVIPDVEKYREEDLGQRMLWVKAFTKDLIDLSVERKDDYISPQGRGHMFKDYSSVLINSFLEGLLGVSCNDFSSTTTDAELLGCGGHSILGLHKYGWYLRVLALAD